MTVQIRVQPDRGGKAPAAPTPTPTSGSTLHHCCLRIIWELQQVAVSKTEACSSSAESANTLPLGSGQQGSERPVFTEEEA